jgi:hypothetical protein
VGWSCEAVIGVVVGCALAVCINALKGTGPSAIANMELLNIPNTRSATATSFIDHSLQFNHFNAVLRGYTGPIVHPIKSGCQSKSNSQAGKT